MATLELKEREKKIRSKVFVCNGMTVIKCITGEDQGQVITLKQSKNIVCV